MNLLDLYRDDASGMGKITSVSGGNEFRGPCPKCGGTDRFGVWPNQNEGAGSFFCGRGALGGNGCGIGGDAIQYLRDVRNYSYHEACDCLGITPARGGESLQYKSPVAPKKYQEPAFVAKEAVYPDDVVDPALWREHGMKFVNECHEAIQSRPMSIAYLMARGISREQIAKFKIGFHGGSTRGDKEYQPTFRPWPSWGLKPETREGGKFRMLILPAGLVLPHIVDGLLHGITIRLLRPDPKQPTKKYHYVRGSIRDMWVTNPTAKVFVLQEAQFDCIAVDGAAGDLVGTVGLGSTGTKPDARTAALLKDSLGILDGLDFDEPRRNPQTGRMERPGAAGGKWWKEQYPDQYKRWPVPVGKDAGEAFAAGVDLRMWIQAGLPPGLQGDKPTVLDNKNKDTLPAAVPVPEIKKPATPSKKKENPEQQRIEQILKAKQFPQTDDVVELRTLLAQAEGFFRVYGKGTGVGPVVSPEWSNKYVEKRSRISWLLYNSEAIGKIIGNLADGLYGPDHLSA
jgi:hypothetical protein